MSKKLKDDFNVSSNLRYEFQRAVLIADDFGIGQIDTFSFLIAMLKDPYSKINETYAENNIRLDPDYIIKYVINSKETYEEILKRKYPDELLRTTQNISETKNEENYNDKISECKEDEEKSDDLNNEDEKILTSKNIGEILSNIQFYFEDEQPINYDFPYSDNLKTAITDAGQRCKTAGQNYIDEENLLYSILNLQDCSAKRILEKMNEGIEDDYEISFDIIDLMESIIANNTIHFNALDKKIIIPKPLEGCCSILNEKYDKGIICDILGRDNEIEKVWSILSKKQKSNVVLLGEAGVGKSSIAEAITMSIVNETCPKDFIGYSVIELNIGGMIAGTKYRGEFEKKVEYLIKFIEGTDKLIIFIDELHHMLGAGSSEGSGPDLSGSLKPILARDKVKFIGATTMNEYNKYVCRDQAFKRRLEPVVIKEPKFEEVLPMLKVKIENLKKYHGVEIDDEKLEYIKLCASCFNTSTANPDKTLDLIDTSMAIAKNDNADKVSRKHIEKVFKENYDKFNKLSDEFKLSTAYHEVGHFVMNKYYENILLDEKVYAVSIVPGFDFLGANILEGTDVLVSYDREYINAEIATLVAGRAAEEIFTKKKSSGASNDLWKATILARNMILKYGISSNSDFSNIYLFDEKGENDIPLTDEVINEVNKEARDIINKVYIMTLGILKTKWDIVQNIVKYIIQKKIVSAKELEKFFK